MRPSAIRRHHPLAAAGSALEHLVLRHFGFQVARAEPKPPRAIKNGGGAPQD
jgi:hypothetical protein